MIEILLALALQSAPYVKNPKYWPTPVMDEVAPPVPQVKAGAVLVLSKTNGFRDDEQIVAANAAVTEIAKTIGHDVFVTENAAVMNARDLARFRVVVLNSNSGNIFNDAQRAAFRTWVEKGGGVVLLHGAGGDYTYDWSWYRDSLLGVKFIGHTAKPDQFQQGDIHVVQPGHRAMRALPAKWTRTEEWYAFDRVPKGNGTRILATVDETSYRPADSQRMGKLHPVIWTRCVVRGRAIFSALGHQAQSYSEPLHRAFIGNAIKWAAGKRC